MSSSLLGPWAPDHPSLESATLRIYKAAHQPFFRSRHLMPLSRGTTGPSFPPGLPVAHIVGALASSYGPRASTPPFGGGCDLVPRLRAHAPSSTASPSPLRPRRYSAPSGSGGPRRIPRWSLYAWRRSPPRLTTTYLSWRRGSSGLFCFFSPTPAEEVLAYALAFLEAFALLRTPACVFLLISFVLARAAVLLQLDGYLPRKPWGESETALLRTMARWPRSSPCSPLPFLEELDAKERSSSGSRLAVRTSSSP